MGQVRIIGGIHRSRILKFKDGINGLRPTLDRVRETLFNWLGQDLTGKNCLDLFAGSGALGFEALSRNAKMVTFVERDSSVVKDLRRNQELLGVTNSEIINSNGINYLDRLPQNFDLIFLDPPYLSELLSKSLDVISRGSILSKDGVIFIEFQTRPNLDNYNIIKEAKAGKIGYMLISPIRE